MRRDSAENKRIEAGCELLASFYAIGADHDAVADEFSVRPGGTGPGKALHFDPHAARGYDDPSEPFGVQATE